MAWLHWRSGFAVLVAAVVIASTAGRPVAARGNGEATRPKDVIAGRDSQLERAVDEALRLLKEKPVNRMMTEPAPPIWGRRPGM